MPILTKGSDLSIDAAFAPQTRSESEALLDVVVEAEAANSSLAVVSPQLASTTMAMANPQPVSKQPAEVRVPQPPRAFNPSLPTIDRLTDEVLATELPVPTAMMPIHAHRGETRVAEAENTGDIAAQISGDLRGIAKEGDAVVVWMLDQSLSMQLDMKHLAEYLVNTLEEIETDSVSQMRHAVVAFGNDVKVVQIATPNAQRVAKAIYNLPADPSGVENTFQSVEWCIDRFFAHIRRTKSGEKQKLLIVWTDQSGDDYLRLEHTVLKCLQHNVRVEIIGPSAVLGAQTGYTAYEHPADGNTYYLPVHRGPDSSFPQKLQLGYWYRGVPNTYHESMRGPYQGTSPRWQGGSNLSAMLSGFSPYALTRLARETGGRYTMYDRPGDRAPFRLEAIQEYMPDYRSLAEIERDLREQPLRQLVLASAAETWKSEHTARSEPPMRFLRRVGWVTPQRFRQLLRNQLQQPMLDALNTSAAVEKSLSYFAMAALAPEWKPNRSIPASQSAGTEAMTMGAATDATGTDDDSGSMDDAPVDDDSSDVADNKTPITDVDAELAQQSARQADVQMSLLEQLYEHEKSKRWRAWSDLNLGRLLMISVRLREYIAATSRLWQHADELRQDTNHVFFSKSDTLLGGPVSEQRLEIARMLLNRCVKDNAGTPWAVMAERELRDQPGLQINERSIPLPKKVIRTPLPPPPIRPALPSL